RVELAGRDAHAHVLTLTQLRRVAHEASLRVPGQRVAAGEHLQRRERVETTRELPEPAAFAREVRLHRADRALLEAPQRRALLRQARLRVRAGEPRFEVPQRRAALRRPLVEATLGALE